MEVLNHLFEGNREHVEELEHNHSDLIGRIQQGQDPEFVTVCCSDSRVSNESSFSHDSPGTNFTVGEIGSKAIDFNSEGEKVISGNVSYIPVNGDPEAIVVLGHTGCGAVTAAYNYMEGESMDGQPDGVKDIVKNLLYPGFSNRRDELPQDDEDAVNHLVEYNVDRQVQHLKDSTEISEDITLIGMVYDIHEAYGGKPGAAYLVNLDGEKGLEELRSEMPRSFRDRGRRLTG